MSPSNPEVKPETERGCDMFLRMEVGKTRDGYISRHRKELGSQRVTLSTWKRYDCAQDRKNSTGGGCCVGEGQLYETIAPLNDGIL